MKYFSLRQLVIAWILMLSLVFVLSPVQKDSYCQAQNLSSWETVLDDGAGPAGFNKDIKSPDPIIATIIKTLLSFLGVLFLILMIYGGFLWMTARGNEDQVTKAKNLITAAVIGLIIILISYVVSYFIVDELSQTTLDF